jgi:hypothetical protein
VDSAFDTNPDDLDDSYTIEYDAKLNHENDSEGKEVLLVPGLALNMPEKMEEIDENNNREQL